MSSHGALTAKIGDFLGISLNPNGYDVFHDHGKQKANVGKIVSWFGDAERPQRTTELSQLDIAIIERKSGHVVLLAEIEETNDTPKGLIADAYATLMADKVTFRRKPLDVGVWTTLLILGKGPRRNERRNMHLSDLVEAGRYGLATGNAAIGHVIIESFDGEADLRVRLLEVIPAS